METKFKFDNIRTLHVELTDKCNAACPMCVRNVSGGPDNPYLPKKEISLELFKSSFTPQFLSQMDRIYFCGNYGDPALGKDLIPILEYIRATKPEIVLGMNTNGGVGSPALWARLGSILNRELDYCTFSIDGLEDTNHIHRRHVRWTHVMQSVKAFIAAGGNAKWDYLIFKHNEHQVEEARKLSQEMGFKEFIAKKTGRFVYFLDNLRVEAFPVYNENMELEYFLEPPSEENSNKVVNQMMTAKALAMRQGKKFSIDLEKKIPRAEGLSERFHQADNEENIYTSKANIRCRVLKDNSIFVSSEGLVFPCCWTAFPINTYWDNNDSLQLRELITRTGGREKIDLNHTALKDIIEGDFFRTISQSWSSPCAKDGKLVSCAVQCGIELEKLSEENVLY